MVERSDWPGQVPRDREYGRFRDPETRYRTKAQRNAKKVERGLRDPEHLAMVGSLWCALGTERDKAIHLHHLQSGIWRRRGLGQKSSDYAVVPILWWRHEELHRLGSRHEYEYFMDHSNGRLDPYALALAFKAVSPDVKLARRVLLAHQDSNRRMVKLLKASLEAS